VKNKMLQRLGDELAQAWTVAVKDMKIYFLNAGMVMFGFLMPFFLFFSFSVQREMDAEQGAARLLAMTLIFTASAAGPMIVPLERRIGTYDRLLAAPMALMTLLLSKTAVGAFFAIATAAVSLIIGIVVFGVTIANWGLLFVGIFLGAFSFSALGMIFGSFPTRNPGSVQMPSTLLRWGLLFVSGVFVPLDEMSALARSVAYLSPLTYAQDLMNHAVLGQGQISSWVDVFALVLTGVLFLLPSLWMHQRSRRLGY
jgi:ABC-2 type transport system permease protein